MGWPACAECPDSGGPADSREASSTLLASGLAIDALDDGPRVARLPNLFRASVTAFALRLLARGAYPNMPTVGPVAPLAVATFLRPFK
jgi:hypothetical protein